MAQYPRIWDTDSIYPGIESSEFTSEYKRAQEMVPQVVSQAQALPPISTDQLEATGKQYAETIEKIYQCLALVGQLSTYVHCLISADVENSNYPPYEGAMSALHAQVEEAYIPIRQRLGEPDDQTFDGFIAAHSYLKTIVFALGEMRKEARMSMDEARETLAAQLSVDGIDAWGRFYSSISGKLKVEVMEKGQVVKKSVGQVSLDAPERVVRENNFYAAQKAWDGIKDHCATALNHIAGTRHTLYKAQKIEHFLDKPLADNRLQRRSLDAMWKTVSDRKKVILPYMKAKAKMLGQEKMAWFDQIAPLGEFSIDFETASSTVVEQFSAFHPAMGEFAHMALSKGWVESENRGGKQQGAYCTDFTVNKEPRVFMTYKDTQDSMNTLAHELGHAYHTWLLREQPEPLQYYIMSTAETASTFAEEIINDHMIANAASDELRLAMMDKALSDAMIMLTNIHCRYIFEYKFYTQRAQGELTSQQLSNLMVESQKEAFMDQLEVYDPLFWASKLHFYISGLSFYNFPYTFGYLFSGALYNLARKEGPSFAQKYDQILISTGAMTTEDVIAKNLGMDIGTTDFWDQSLDLIEERVGQFMALAKKLGKV